MCRGYSSIKEFLFWAILMRYLPARWIAKRTHPQWRHWLVVLLALPLVAGCATAWRVAENPMFQSAVQYGVIKYLSGKPDQQPHALKIVQHLQHAADQEAQVTVRDIEDLAIGKIPWENLDLADQHLLRSMIEDIGEYLREQVGEGKLDEDDQVRLKEFLNWIEHAIHFAAKR